MTLPPVPQWAAHSWARLGAAAHRGADWLTSLSGWRRYLVAFGLGVLTATALAPYYVLPALFAGFTGLVLLIDGANRAAKPKRVGFLVGWAFGFGYFLFGMYWLGFAFLVQADEFGWMIPIAIPAFTGFLGLFCAAPAALALIRWRPGMSRILTLAAFWALFEFVRGNILTGLPWNLTSQTFAGTALLAQPLAWVGPYGYSLMLLILAMLPAAALSESKRLSSRPILGLAAGLVAIILFGGIRLSLAPGESPEDAPTLLVVQPNVAQRDKLDPQKQAANFQAMLRMTADAAEGDGPILAVWPENAHPYLANASDAPTYFADVLPPNVTLASGTIRAWEDGAGHTRYGNSVAIFGATREGLNAPEKPLVDVYDKHHLVPFGEYLPLNGLLTRLGLSQLAPVGEGFTPGAGPRVIEAGGVRFAPLICYEDVFPRALYPHDDRPDLLVVVTNDAWFGDGAGPRQHFDISRMRVIESGLPMARAANTGISSVFGPFGEIVKTTSLYTTGVISAPMPLRAASTFYNRAGELLFVFMCLACALHPIFPRVARNA